MMRTGALVWVMATSIGCAAAAVGYGSAPQPHLEYDFPSDGPEEGDVLRAAFDARGGLQAAATGDYVDLINRRCLAESRTLVLLVHGINNSYAEARTTYEVVRLKLGQLFRGARFLFLEVYWDGLTGDPLVAWGRARENSKWVGLGLRRLLGGLDPRISIRALAHSRGAAVVSSALWNLPLREDVPSDEEFRARQAEVPVPVLPRMRIGFLVPALPPQDFESYFDGRSAFEERVVIGVNEDDPAVGKGFFPSGLFGSTRLGCDLGAARAYVEEPLNAKGAAAHVVDLSGSDVHDFKHYVLRKPTVEQFLPLLFERDGLAGPAR